MRTDLDHLPAAKQRKLERVVEIIFGEFSSATEKMAGPRKGVCALWIEEADARLGRARARAARFGRATRQSHAGRGLSLTRSRTPMSDLCGKQTPETWRLGGGQTCGGRAAL